MHHVDYELILIKCYWFAIESAEDTQAVNTRIWFLKDNILNHARKFYDVVEFPAQDSMLSAAMNILTASGIDLHLQYKEFSWLER